MEVSTADVDSVGSCLDHHVEAVATSIGPIVGAAVGGLVVLGFIITGVVIILVWRRRTPAENGTII
jgi:hypothetical protein